MKKRKCCTVMKNVYRAKWCAAHGLTPLAKIFMQLNSIFFGCHIHYSADIPKGTAISHHGIGVVINGACKIGNRVVIGHGVTIGNRMPFHVGHPVIGDDVYIGSGAYVGGGINIGDKAFIGAHAVVIKDVPPGCTAVGNPARIIVPKETHKPVIAE